MVVFKLLIVAGLVAAAAAERKVATTTPCDGLTARCTVGQVSIDPCKQAPRPCVLKRGKTAQIDFNFTPDFSATKLKTAAYWPHGDSELEFTGFGSSDGCLYTSCPTVTGQQQFFNYTVAIGSKLPGGVFQFKWKIWNEDNPVEVCCFQTSVNLK